MNCQCVWSLDRVFLLTILILCIYLNFILNDFYSIFWKMHENTISIIHLIWSLASMLVMYNSQDPTRSGTFPRANTVNWTYLIHSAIGNSNNFDSDTEWKPYIQYSANKMLCLSVTGSHHLNFRYQLWKNLIQIG